MAKKPVSLISINLRNIMNEIPLMTALDYVPEIKTGIEAVKLVQTAKAAIADAQTFVATTSATAAIFTAFAKVLGDIIESAFNTGYYQLVTMPVAGGWQGFEKEFNANLRNELDKNRPVDEGGAALAAVIWMINYKDQSEALDKIQQMVEFFNSYRNGQREILKDIIGYADLDELNEYFWGHYYKKQLAGTHKAVPGNWTKYAISDLFPSVFDKIKTQLDTIQNEAIPNVDAFAITKKIEKYFDDLIALLEDFIVVIDAWKKLLLDSSITVIVTPIITGYAGTATAISASDNLASYICDIYNQIDQKTYKFIDNVFGEKTDPDEFDNNAKQIIKNDNYVGAVTMVFKGPSFDVCGQYIGNFCKLFGIPYDTESVFSESPFV